jgi:hypothetical protein
MNHGDIAKLIKLGVKLPAEILTAREAYLAARQSLEPVELPEVKFDSPDKIIMARLVAERRNELIQKESSQARAHRESTADAHYRKTVAANYQAIAEALADRMTELSKDATIANQEAFEVMTEQIISAISGELSRLKVRGVFGEVNRSALGNARFEGYDRDVNAADLVRNESFWFGPEPHPALTLENCRPEFAQVHELNATITIPDIRATAEAIALAEAQRIVQRAEGYRADQNLTAALGLAAIVLNRNGALNK